MQINEAFRRNGNPFDAWKQTKKKWEKKPQQQQQQQPIDKTCTKIQHVRDTCAWLVVSRKERNVFSQHTAAADKRAAVETWKMPECLQIETYNYMMIANNMMT